MLKNSNPADLKDHFEKREYDYQHDHFDPTCECYEGFAVETQEDFAEQVSRLKADMDQAIRDVKGYIMDADIMLIDGMMWDIKRQIDSINERVNG